MAKIYAVKNCSYCPHQDHSGSFTPGGAKPLCNNPDVKGKDHFIEFEGNRKAIARVRPGWTDTPDWCPLEDLK